MLTNRKKVFKAIYPNKERFRNFNVVALGELLKYYWEEDLKSYLMF